MNRKYKVEDFIKIIKKIKKEIPDITIATDIISAYPHETREEHEETIELIRKINPDVLNLTRYWARPGTRAAKEKQIESKIARARTLEIQKLHLSLSLEKNKKLEGKEIEVFVNEKTGNTYFSRTRNYKIVIIKTDKKLLGRTIKVRIKQAFSHYFLGEIS